MTRRYEYKYAIDLLPIESVLDTIRYHSAGFVEAFPQRRVNNFYLDTLNLDFFYQNVDGISRRRKFRYRWYGDFDLTDKAQLETKHKENELGWKDTLHIPISHITSEEKLKDHFRSLGLSEAELFPRLYNSYSRYYFLSADSRFRITIDYDQKFGLPYHFGQAHQALHQAPELILELKFDEQDHNDRGLIMQELPFLRTKNSKYANGITALLLD